MEKDQHAEMARAEERCRVESPPLREVQSGHHVACHLR